MSRVGAMIKYALAKVVVANGDVTTTDVERSEPEIKDHELPFCMAYGVARETTLDEFRQRQEVTAITLAYLDKFDSTQDPLSSLLAVEEAIESAIWDGNVLDTDGAGFFAYVSAFGVEKAETEAERHVLVMEVVFETIDVEDSAFALTES